MNIRNRIFDFVRAVQRSPELGSNQAELARLESAAINSYEGMFAANSAPIAKYTWEVATPFSGSDDETDRIPIRIPLPSKIIGMQVWIEPTSSGGVAPTLSSLLVSLDINNEKRLTSQQGQITTGAQVDSVFVTAGSICVAFAGGGGLRLFGWRIDNTTTDIGFTFRWKRGAGVYDDAIISVSLFATDLDEDTPVSVRGRGNR